MNEAAERPIRIEPTGHEIPAWAYEVEGIGEVMVPLVLKTQIEAAERKATVERIRAALSESRDAEGSDWRWSIPQGTLRVLDAILDAEEER